MITAEITEEAKPINEKIEEDLGAGLGKEALRVVQLRPDEWIPGILDEKPVRVQARLLSGLHGRGCPRYAGKLTRAKQRGQRYSRQKDQKCRQLDEASPSYDRIYKARQKSEKAQVNNFFHRSISY